MSNSETTVAADPAAHAAGDLALERAPDIIVTLNARSPEAAADILQNLSSETYTIYLRKPTEVEV